MLSDFFTYGAFISAHSSNNLVLNEDTKAVGISVANSSVNERLEDPQTERRLLSGITAAETTGQLSIKNSRL